MSINRESVIKRLRLYTLAGLVILTSSVARSELSTGAELENCLGRTTEVHTVVVAAPAVRSTTYSRFRAYLATLQPGVKVTPGKGPHLLVAAIELGAVPGLKNSGGKPLSLSAGGVGSVITDWTNAYPDMLAEQGGKIEFMGVLMKNMSTEGMTEQMGADGQPLKMKVTVEGHTWYVGIYKYLAPNGAEYTFLENPEFHQRFNAMPAKGKSIYDMEGLDPKNPQDQLQIQRIYSAINQAGAQYAAMSKIDVLMPQDSHFAPMSFYTTQHYGLKPLSNKDTVHNEVYVNAFYAGGVQYDVTRSILNVTPTQMNDYFMHGDQSVMAAAAIRTAEKEDIFTGYSVSTGTATDLNANGLQKTYPPIDIFGRLAHLTNFLGKENRPENTEALKPATAEELATEGIADSGLIALFKKGLNYGKPGQTPAAILNVMKAAKAGIQRHYHMTEDPNKPLFLSFARLVHQKGMTFALQNVKHILQQGGQVIIGGPAGDEIGESERVFAVQIKQELEAAYAHDKRQPNPNDFVFIDGRVQGRIKALLLTATDAFLVPSRNAPCELTDVETAAFGGQPVVHAIGGLTKVVTAEKYGPVDPDNQGWELGQAIDRVMNNYRGNRKQFDQNRLKGMKQDFSAENHYERFMLIQRIEAYGKMIRDLDQQISQRTVTEAQAQRLLQQDILTEHKGDVPDLIAALKMLNNDRRTPLIKWLIGT